VGGINSQQVEVNLREHPDRSSKIIGTLGGGEFASLIKPSNKWNYFYSINQHQNIQKKYFKLGYSRAFGIIVLKTKQLEIYQKNINTYAPYIIVLSALLLFLGSSYSQKGQKKTEQAGVTSHLVREKEKKQKERENNLARDNFFLRVNQELTATHAATDKKNLAKQETTIHNLEKKTNDYENKALNLGFDLKNENINSIIKGRLFEYFVGNIWKNDNRIKILYWTGDKGIDEKIYTESNCHPDFVILNIYTNKEIAVECKFRKHFRQGSFVDIKEDSVNRYKKYQIDKNITVFLLLGIEGDEKDPDNLFLLPINDLDKIKTKKQNDDDINIHTIHQRLKPYKRNKAELVDHLFK